MSTNTILVPLDGSPGAEAVLPVVLPLASHRQARLLLVAVHEPGVPARGATGIPEIDRVIDEESRAAMGAYLNEVAARLGPGPGRVETLVLQGKPSERLAACAREADVDLVAMASHGRGGWSRFWLGSVTDQLLRAVEVPLLVVKTQEHPSVAPRELRRVLVPLDGSAVAELAVGAVARTMADAPVEYVLLRVARRLHPMVRTIASTDTLERDFHEQTIIAQAYIEDAASRLGRRGLDVRPVVRSADDVAKEVFAEALETRADLIALTTHGEGMMGRILVGSVADKIIRGSPVPVLVRRIVPQDAGQVTTSADRESRDRAIVGVRDDMW